MAIYHFHTSIVKASAGKYAVASAAYMALPIELSKKEKISLAKRFVKENFVDKGMAVDFSIHDLDYNPHVHAMCTVRGFNKNGTWATMEKKVYARDENGNKIPEIDPKTGKQKVRVRKGKGTEKIWKRVTVKSNDWNSKEQLLSWRKNWADMCNEYLEENNKITHLSLEAQGIDRVSTIHPVFDGQGKTKT